MAKITNAASKPCWTERGCRISGRIAKTLRRDAPHDSQMPLKIQLTPFSPILPTSAMLLLVPLELSDFHLLSHTQSYDMELVVRHGLIEVECAWRRSGTAA